QVPLLPQVERDHVAAAGEDGGAEPLGRLRHAGLLVVAEDEEARHTHSCSTRTTASIHWSNGSSSANSAGAPRASVSRGRGPLTDNCVTTTPSGSNATGSGAITRA